MLLEVSPSCGDSLDTLAGSDNQWGFRRFRGVFWKYLQRAVESTLHTRCGYPSNALLRRALEIPTGYQNKGMNSEVKNQYFSITGMFLGTLSDALRVSRTGEGKGHEVAKLVKSRPPDTLKIRLQITDSEKISNTF